MLELTCKEMVFHFNKAHIADPNIPMWVVKAKGETFYVNHVECTVPWSTKETSDNPHTKGSIKIKHCLLTIQDDNTAVITQLTKEAENRLIGVKPKSRFITSYGATLRSLLSSLNLEHGPIKIRGGGGCSTTWFITELNDEDATVLLLNWPHSIKTIRSLKPNEDYYKWYSDSTVEVDEEEDDEEFYDDY